MVNIQREHHSEKRILMPLKLIGLTDAICKSKEPMPSNNDLKLTSVQAKLDQQGQHKATL